MCRCVFLYGYALQIHKDLLGDLPSQVTSIPATPLTCVEDVIDCPFHRADVFPVGSSHIHISEHGPYGEKKTQMSRSSVHSSRLSRVALFAPDSHRMEYICWQSQRCQPGLLPKAQPRDELRNTASIPAPNSIQKPLPHWRRIKHPPYLSAPCDKGTPPHSSLAPPPPPSNQRPRLLTPTLLPDQNTIGYSSPSSRRNHHPSIPTQSTTRVPRLKSAPAILRNTHPKPNLYTQAT